MGNFISAILPIVLFIVLLLIVVAIFNKIAASGNRSRLTGTSIRQKQEQLEKDMAEIRARNQAQLEQTRAELERAQATREQLVKETREAVRAATKDEMEQARAQIARERAQNLTELRREAQDIMDRTDQRAAQEPKKPEDQE
ncbi:MAG TPA: hypothetical protein VH186_17205 [Chloroflexia bacterium]|nr:hypothetical protein [Chloroflexia bacterium]